MDITLYEMGTSRSLRCRWTLKEIGLEYKSIEDRSLLRSNELKKIHPLGKMPAAFIDGMPLFESSAICNYIADQTKEVNLIAKTGTWSRALHDQWVLFNLTELEAWLWSTAVNTFVLPEDERITDCIPQNAKMFKKGAIAIDQYLANQDYFVENRFTVADIIIGYTLNWARRMELVKDFKSINLYLERLFSREHCELPE
jgi:glutathione S-transferase